MLASLRLRSWQRKYCIEAEVIGSRKKYLCAQIAVMPKRSYPFLQTVKKTISDQNGVFYDNQQGSKAKG
jgi:hypothetical protein